MKRWIRILPLLCLSASLCATLAAAELRPAPLDCHEMAALWFGNQDGAQLLGGDGAEAALSGYFTARESAFRGDMRLLSADEDMGAAVAANNALRTERVKEMEARLGFTVLDADVTTKIERERTARNPDGTLTMRVYEWTFYDYDDLADGAGGLDVTGFGTWHILTVAERPDGSFEILADEYDESDILGINTLSAERQRELASRAPEEAAPAGTPEPGDAASLLAISYYADYNPQAAIDYSEAYWQNYNPKYANFNSSGGDCANFTSQSIYADGKGMPQVATKNGALNGWYYKSANDRSGTWASSTNLRIWMGNNRGHLVNLRQESKDLSGAPNNVFAGSPVFYSTKADGTFQHTVLCVGTNSAGTPVINSHNSDRYHAVWNYYGGSQIIDTVQLTSRKFGSFSGYVKLDADFYAYIISPALNRYLTNDGAGKVTSRAKKQADNEQASQIWRFVRQDDGSYQIESARKDAGQGAQKKPALAAQGGAWDSRTPICTEEYKAEPGQQWHIYKNDGGAYLLRPKCSDRVMDIVEGSDAEGQGLWLFSKQSAAEDLQAQLFQISKTAWVELDTPVLDVKVEGSEGANVTFSWNAIDGAASYVLHVIQNGKDVRSINGTRTVVPLKLEPGKYEAKVEAFSPNNRTFSVSETQSVDIPTSFTIAYRSNGGQSEPPEQMKVEYVDVKLTEELPVRTGYAFVAWNTKAGGEGADYAPGATYSRDEDLTLYARWTPCEYVVTLDPNGGSLPEEQRTYPVTYTKPYGEHGEEGKMPVPELKDNEFLGWYTELTEGEPVTEETVVETPQDHTLYAHWESSLRTITPFVTKDGTQHNIRTMLFKIPDGALFACGYLNGQFVAATSAEVKNGAADDMLLNGDFDEIMIMAFEGTENMRPLCEAKSVPKNKFVGS